MFVKPEKEPGLEVKPLAHTATSLAHTATSSEQNPATMFQKSAASLFQKSVNLFRKSGDGYSPISGAESFMKGKEGKHNSMYWSIVVLFIFCIQPFFFFFRNILYFKKS